MTVTRVQISPPIGRDGFNCRNCGGPIYAVAKVIYSDGRASWFAFQHGDGKEACPSLTIAEPFDAAQANYMVEVRLAEQAAPEAGEKIRSEQACRVTAALDLLRATERTRRAAAAAGDRVQASALAGALRGLIEDLPVHDLRSLTLRLFLASVAVERAGQVPAGRLYVTRGLPASGKTTRARSWVAKDPQRRVRVNRDDLRKMTHDGWTGERWHEDMVSYLQHPGVLVLLQAGYDVVVDDTNLNPLALEALEGIAAVAGTELEIWDMTGVPLYECLLRNNRRLGTPEYVPTGEIQRMWSSFIDREEVTQS